MLNRAVADPMNRLAAFELVLSSRKSTRGFLPDPVPDRILQDAFELAGRSPSNCNSQPWLVEVLSGATRDRMSAALVQAAGEGRYTPDFPFDETEYTGLCNERRKEQGARYFQAMGIAREDKEARSIAVSHNLRFFGAPHAAFLFMPMFSGGVRVASDIGMYGQTLLLSLEAHGISSCPQTVLGFFAETVRQVLGIDECHKLLFGISFGYEDPTAPANAIRLPRAPLGETTRFYR